MHHQCLFVWLSTSPLATDFSPKRHVGTYTLQSILEYIWFVVTIIEYTKRIVVDAEKLRTWWTSDIASGLCNLFWRCVCSRHSTCNWIPTLTSGERRREYCKQLYDIGRPVDKYNNPKSTPARSMGIVSYWPGGGRPYLDHYLRLLTSPSPLHMVLEITLGSHFRLRSHFSENSVSLAIRTPLPKKLSLIVIHH